jgi:hypothetical protein
MKEENTRIARVFFDGINVHLKALHPVLGIHSLQKGCLCYTIYLTYLFFRCLYL